MKKIVLACLVLCSARWLAAQCSVDTIPNAFNNNGECYINDFDVDGNPISTGTGYQSSGPSYQAFNSPYVILEQGAQHWIDLGTAHQASVTICMWIDYNNDGIYDASEQALYVANYSSLALFTPIGIPLSTLPDTVHMRITVQEYAPTWGQNNGDACLAPGIGETEDYIAIIHCASPQPVGFDPAPNICFADSVELNAFSTAEVAWYTGSPPVFQTIGNTYYLHTSPNATDTTIFVQFVSPGCFSGWLDPMNITFLPSPVANISGPDTITSCSSVTISAAPGPGNYQWNSGDTGSTITITNGFGGNLMLTVSLPNGCADQDQIYASVATAPPATYSHVYSGNNFCSSLELALGYDSLIAPGTCSWYLYPSNTFIGSGNNISYTVPDTGVYQFMAIVNSVCGIDTMIHTYNVYNTATYDSLYMPFTTQDINGTYVFCFNNAGTIDIVLGGLNGTVTGWILTDTTLGFTMPWNDDTTLTLPANLAQSGHVYSATAIVANPQGCPDTTETIFMRPQNTMNFNISDTSWQCSFPVAYGFSSASYATYDFLWSTGDTTNFININGPMDVTLHVVDNVSGCITDDTAYVGDASQQANLFGDTIFSCSGSVYIDPSFVQYSANSWTEFDLNWSQIGGSNTNDYTVYNMIGDEYLVFEGYNAHGCYIFDTTLISFNGNFTFSLGPDITTTVTPVTISGPYGYGQFNYTWMPGNVSSQNLQVTTSGTYTLTVNNGYGCTYSDVVVVNILPMDISENAPLEISVYPNPANDLVTVKASATSYTVQVYDAQGRCVKSQQVDGTNNADVYVGDLAAGYYTMEVVAASAIQRSKLIIQRQ